MTTNQLRLIEGGAGSTRPATWQLDDETIALGRAGVAAARAALHNRRADGRTAA